MTNTITQTTAPATNTTAPVRPVAKPTAPVSPVAKTVGPVANTTAPVSHLAAAPVSQLVAAPASPVAAPVTQTVSLTPAATPAPVVAVRVPASSPRTGSLLTGSPPHAPSTLPGPSSQRRAAAASGTPASPLAARPTPGGFGRSPLTPTTTLAATVTAPRVVGLAAGGAIARSADTGLSPRTGPVSGASRSDPGPGPGSGTGGGSGAFFFGAIALLALAGLAVPRALGVVCDFTFCAALEPCLMLPEHPG